MHELSKFQQQKEKIISLIHMKGPSLPVHISKNINVMPLFAGAFLAELYSEKRIKISNMKVGSSPLYYMEGQEAMLENFINYLQAKEKEAFLLLKQERVLEDEMQTPVTRVALRAIKDFAIPIKVRINEELKLFWRHFLISEQEAKILLHQKLFPQEQKKQKEQEKETEVTKIVDEMPIKIPDKTIKQEEAIKTEIPKFLSEKSNPDIKEIPNKEKKEHEKQKLKEFTFPKKIKSHLTQRDIEIKEVLAEKKKEFIAKIRIDILFGKQEFMLIAKDKKTITEIDIALALQSAQASKMPALIFSSGKLHKKAEEYLSQWGNLVKFEKINV